MVRSFWKTTSLPAVAAVSSSVVASAPRDRGLAETSHHARVHNLLDIERLPELPPFPRCPDDIHELWHNWINRGWFEWESVGYPFWSNIYHTQTYWQYRHLPNFLFLHYADMLADLDGTIRRIAAYIDHPVHDETVARVASRTNFAAVKQDAIERDAKDSQNFLAFFFKGGASAFINQGTKGTHAGLCGMAGEWWNHWQLIYISLHINVNKRYNI